MVDQLRSAALLRGFRGRALMNEAAFKDIVLRVSRLVEACPDIAELDFNPVIVGEAGALVVDARVRVEPS
jgi:acetyltransferase